MQERRQASPLKARVQRQRRPHPTDRRATQVFLTAKIDALQKPILKSGTYVTNQMVANISRRDREQLVDLLLKVKQNTQAMITDA